MQFSLSNERSWGGTARRGLVLNRAATRTRPVVKPYDGTSSKEDMTIAEDEATSSQDDMAWCTTRTKPGAELVRHLAYKVSMCSAHTT